MNQNWLQAQNMNNNNAGMAMMMNGMMSGMNGNDMKQLQALIAQMQQV
jgi:hypothetical protein